MSNKHTPRFRSKGDTQPTGSKLRKAIKENRLTLHGTVTGPTLWALSRGKRACV